MDILFAVGRVAKDAEVKSTSSGRTVVKFAVACDRKDKKAVFYNCDFWGERAGKLASYIKKGTWVSVIAKPEDYTGNDGKVYTTYQVLDFGFAGSKASSESSDEITEDFAKVIEQEFKKPSPTGVAPNYGTAQGTISMGGDDDIPF